MVKVLSVILSTTVSLMVLMFRGMRKSLLNSFNTIYLFNLHGSNRRTEETSDCTQKDENVFDISQGVSILLCVKGNDNQLFTSKSSIMLICGDLGKRNTIRFQKPMFNPRNGTSYNQYRPTIFLCLKRQTIENRIRKWIGRLLTSSIAGSIGIATRSRDRFTIHWTPEEIHETVTDFVSLSVDKARENIRITKGYSRLAEFILPKQMSAIIRRFRTTYCSQFSIVRLTHAGPIILGSREDFIVCLVVQLCFISLRKTLPSASVALSQVPHGNMSFITNKITDGNRIFQIEGVNLFMCFHSTCIQTLKNWDLRQNVRSISNLLFSQHFSEALELPQIEPFNLPEGVSPEEILAYIYAVLYSPTYRERYYDFLKYDFPRIPLPQRTLNSSVRLQRWGSV